MVKKTKKRINLKKHFKKTRRMIKGGFLETMGIGINGINLGRTTGKKRYNWKTGKFDDVTCYNIGLFNFCKNPQ